MLFSSVRSPWFKNCLLFNNIFNLSKTCSGGAFTVVLCLSCVVCRASSAIPLNIFSFQTAGPIWTKLGRNVPLEALFKNCSPFDSIKILVAMATKWIFFFSKSLKIFSSGTTGQILKLFHRNVPWVTLFKTAWENSIH